jgi:hypothetical protein
MSGTKTVQNSVVATTTMIVITSDGSDHAGGSPNRTTLTAF